MLWQYKIPKTPSLVSFISWYIRSPTLGFVLILLSDSFQYCFLFFWQVQVSNRLTELHSFLFCLYFNFSLFSYGFLIFIFYFIFYISVTWHRICSISMQKQNWLWLLWRLEDIEFIFFYKFSRNQIHCFRSIGFKVAIRNPRITQHNYYCLVQYQDIVVYMHILRWFFHLPV